MQHDSCCISGENAVQLRLLRFSTVTVLEYASVGPSRSHVGLRTFHRGVGSGPDHPGAYCSTPGVQKRSPVRLRTPLCTAADMAMYAWRAEGRAGAHASLPGAHASLPGAGPVLERGVSLLEVNARSFFPSGGKDLALTSEGQSLFQGAPGVEVQFATGGPCQGGRGREGGPRGPCHASSGVATPRRAPPRPGDVSGCRCQLCSWTSGSTLAPMVLWVRRMLWLRVRPRAPKGPSGCTLAPAPRGLW